MNKLINFCFILILFNLCCGSYIAHFQTVDLKNWKRLDGASVQVDSSVSDFDIVHISRDIAKDLDKVRAWCLSGNISIYPFY